MKLLVRLPKEQSNFIESTFNKIEIEEEPTNEEWFYNPFYFKKVAENEFEVVSYKNLPKDVINAIKSMRDKTETT